MLRSLFIKNYALIEEITVTFDRGLSIITGETGAGKSILLGALGLLLGERASADLIRTGADKAIVEAEFDLNNYPHISKFLSGEGFDSESGSVMIRREISRKGTSRAFINDTPASLQQLKQTGELLVDLHGQHEHQSLLHSERHIDFLDEYANVNILQQNYSVLYDEFSARRTTYNDLKKYRESAEKERNFLEFQRTEIEAVAPLRGEDEEIQRKLSVLEHSEELQLASSELHTILYDDEDSIFEKLSASKLLLEQLTKFDTRFDDQLKELTASLESIRELAHSVSRYADHLESDPAKLQQLRSRDLELTRLKKKYGPSLNNIIDLHERIIDLLGDGGSIDEQIIQAEQALLAIQKKSSKAAFELSDARSRAAKKFEKQITAELQTLGIEHGVFAVHIIQKERPNSDLFSSAVVRDNIVIEANNNGCDHVEFYISTNKGEHPKPMAKVASGGEVSRIMLAIKTVLSASEQIPVLIFDEIDTGISGRVAQRVGTAMKRLAKKHQLIAITHLGQIASFGDHHYIVEKNTTGTNTTSHLRLLSAKEHEAEIARLLSGETITGESLKAARSLLHEAESLAA